MDPFPGTLPNDQCSLVFRAAADKATTTRWLVSSCAVSNFKTYQLGANPRERRLLVSGGGKGSSSGQQEIRLLRACHATTLGEEECSKGGAAPLARNHRIQVASSTFNLFHFTSTLLWLIAHKITSIDS